MRLLIAVMLGLVAQVQSYDYRRVNYVPVYDYHYYRPVERVYVSNYYPYYREECCQRVCRWHNNRKYWLFGSRCY